MIYPLWFVEERREKTWTFLQNTTEISREDVQTEHRTQRAFGSLYCRFCCCCCCMCEAAPDSVFVLLLLWLFVQLLLLFRFCFGPPTCEKPVFHLPKCLYCFCNFLLLHVLCCFSCFSSLFGAVFGVALLLYSKKTFHIPNNAHPLRPGNSSHLTPMYLCCLDAPSLGVCLIDRS